MYGSIVANRPLYQFLQINDFEGDGVAIGLSCSHMLADLTSATLLFKSWTEVSRREPIEHPPFFNSLALHGQLVPNKHTQLGKYHATKSEEQFQASVKMATATFKVSNSVIKQCLYEVNENCPNATPFELLAGLFWSRITRLKGPKSCNTHSLSICIDSRRLLQDPLTIGYFGNALHFSQLSLKGEEIGHCELGHVVELVHNRVLGIKKEEFWSVMNWFEAQKGEGGKFAPPFRMYGPELTCISLEHMLVPSKVAGSINMTSLIYAATLDKEEKPVHVSCHVGNVEGEGLIVVMPSMEEGLARTVLVTLPEKELAELCEDQAILRLEPTMLLSGKR